MGDDDDTLCTSSFYLGKVTWLNSAYTEDRNSITHRFFDDVDILQSNTGPPFLGWRWKEWPEANVIGTFRQSGLSLRYRVSRASGSDDLDGTEETFIGDFYACGLALTT